MYSYGMTCYEIIRGRILFENTFENCFLSDAIEEILGGRHRDLLIGLPSFLRSIIVNC